MPKRDLGISDPDAAGRSLHTDILHRLDRRIARCSGFRLSLLSRHMWLSRSWCPCSPTMGPSAKIRKIWDLHPSASRHRPAAAGAAPLFPSRAISTRTLQQGGIVLVDIPAQLTALQANTNGRLLEPERVPWKAYFSSWVAMPLTAEQRIIAQQSSIIVAAGQGTTLLQLPHSQYPDPAACRSLLGDIQAAAPLQAGQPRAHALPGGHGAALIPHTPCGAHIYQYISFLAWRRLTCLSRIANRMCLGNHDRQIKQSIGV